MTSPGFVLARFVEAADTARRLPSSKIRPAGYKSAWVEYVHDFADRVHWDEDRRLEDAKERLRQAPPSAGAISRHDECMAWGIDVLDERHRLVLWQWSFCAVTERSFLHWCKRIGLNRMTAYRRVTRASEAISRELGKSSANATDPDWSRVLHLAPNLGMNADIISREDVGEDIRVKGLRIYRPSEAVPQNRPDLRGGHDGTQVI